MNTRHRTAYCLYYTGFAAKVQALFGRTGLKHPALPTEKKNFGRDRDCRTGRHGCTNCDRRTGDHRRRGLACRAPRAGCLLLALALAFCLGGCGRQEGLFIGSIDAVPSTLDPQLADGEAACIVAVNLFEGLFRLSADGEVLPAACESYTVSDDGLTWRFTLRAGLHYNDEDKTPLTAQDYVFGLRRLFAAGEASPWRDTFAGLAGAAEILAGTAGPERLGVSAGGGGRELTIRLALPDDELPRKLCCPGAMPCNQAFYEATDGTYGLQSDTILANGPFRLTLWNETSGVTLRRVEAQEGLVNRVRLLLRAENADADYSGRFVSGMPQQAGQQTFCVTTQLLLFNAADPQLASADVRAGLAGVLYQALPAPQAEGVSSAGGLVPDSLTFAGKSWRQQAGNLLGTALPADAPAAYRRGLAASEANKLEGVTVLVPDTPDWQALYETVALAWQQQLSAFFSVRYLPEEEIAAAVAAGDYQLAFVSQRAAADDVAAQLAVFADYTRDAGGLTDDFAVQDADGEGQNTGPGENAQNAGTAGSTAASENHVPTGSADPAGAQDDTAADPGEEMSAGLPYTSAAQALDAAAVATGTQQAYQALLAAETLLLRQWTAAPLRTVTEYYALAPGFGGVGVSPYGPLLDFAAATAAA